MRESDKAGKLLVVALSSAKENVDQKFENRSLFGEFRDFADQKIFRFGCWAQWTTEIKSDFKIILTSEIFTETHLI